MLCLFLAIKQHVRFYQHVLQLRILRWIKRPAYQKTDRLLLVLLARMVRTWKQALFLVQPECLDHFLIFHEKHLYYLLKAYAVYFNQARPHQGLGPRILDPLVLSAPLPNSPNQAIAIPVLGGLHHDYRIAA